MDEATEPGQRSPRAETARDWFWTLFGIQWVTGMVLVKWLDLEFLDHGWWLVPRYMISAAFVIAGAIWAWETYQRRKRLRHREATR